MAEKYLATAEKDLTTAEKGKKSEPRYGREEQNIATAEKRTTSPRKKRTSPRKKRISPRQRREESHHGKEENLATAETTTTLPRQRRTSPKTYLSWQKHACRDDKHIFVVTKVLLWKICRVCCDKLTFVTTNMCLSRQIFCRDKSMHVATKFLSWQASFCRDKRRVLSRQTQACRDKNHSCGSSHHWYGPAYPSLMIGSRFIGNALRWAVLFLRDVRTTNLHIYVTFYITCFQQLFFEFWNIHVVVYCDVFNVHQAFNFSDEIILNHPVLQWWESSCLETSRRALIIIIITDYLWIPIS